MKKRVASLTLALAFVLSLSLLAIPVSANQCPIIMKHNNMICGRYVMQNSKQGVSVEVASHKYFFDLLTCKYTITTTYYATICTDGHILSTKSVPVESDHDCR
jgi:hypothetical protein